jgi:2-keto-4-pentenoate hydratase/2-oxohepta-3-ene-1,7-dioic acid hydratase in catechol pathway
LRYPEIDLLDYEVEIGVVFANDVRDPAAIDSQLAGVFVANDLTARCLQISKVRGHTARGFGDAKSLPGFLPVGPILAVPPPGTLAQLLGALKLQLRVNGQVRQEADAAAMSFPLTTIMQRAFELDRKGFTMSVKGNPVALLSQGFLPKGSLVLTGTPGGTAFQVPSAGSKCRAVLRAMLPMPIPRSPAIPSRIRGALIGREKMNPLYLKTGDVVEAEVFGLGIARTEIE